MFTTLARANLRLENINMRSKLILNSAQKGRYPEQPHNGSRVSVTGCPEHQYGETSVLTFNTCYIGHMYANISRAKVCHRASGS